MNDPSQNQQASLTKLLLGKKTAYQNHYNADLLMAVARADARINNKIPVNYNFYGVDIWNAWEISWLDDKGKPMVACGRFEYSAQSKNIIESKSFKLYLNSLNQTKFASVSELESTLSHDLSHIVGSEVKIELYQADDQWPRLAPCEGICLDQQEISIDVYELDSELLKNATNDDDTEDNNISEQLYSHLFKSNCMVTGQPDWASVFIHYQGKAIDHEALLRYLISFREHQAFHEPCVEKIFSDLMNYCQPEKLIVYCRYTRRGGLDINPFRSTHDQIPSNMRIWRQ